MTIYYYCKCDTGCHANCLPGNSDLNTGLGTTQALARITPTVGQVNALAAGDQILFCQGGAWTAFGLGGIVNPLATPTSPVTFGNYAPPTGATGNPKLNSTGIAFNFGSGGDSSSDGGYTIDGLDMTGPGSGGGTVGVFLGGRSVRWITVQNCLIQRFYNGFQWDETEASALYNTFGKIKNNTIRENYGTAGVIGACQDWLVEGNIFDKNGFGGALGHHNYFAGNNIKRVTVRNNTYSAAGQGILLGTECQGGNITVHGGYVQLLIEGNTIYNTSYAASGCAGISVNPGYDDTIPAEYFRQVIIRGNTVVNAASQPISSGASPNIIIENNVVVDNIGGNTVVAIAIPRESAGGAGEVNKVGYEDADSAPTVRNNSIYLVAPGDGSVGLRLGFGTGHGTNAKVANNLVYMTAGTGARSCYTQMALSNYTVWNNNLCFGATQYSPTYANLAAAQAAGYDTNGSAADPLITTPTSGNSWNMALTSDASPAHNTGSNTYKAIFDRLGCSRDTTPSIGAFERGGTGCSVMPQSPQFLR